MKGRRPTPVDMIENLIQYISGMANQSSYVESLNHR